MSDTMRNILTLSQSLDNMSEDKIDSLVSVQNPPTFPYTSDHLITPEEADKIFQEFDICFPNYAA